MKIEFLDVAQNELPQAFEWYETQQKDLVMHVLNEVDNAIRRTISYPESYILIKKDVRRCLAKCYLFAFLHRKPDYWIGRA